MLPKRQILPLAFISTGLLILIGLAGFVLSQNIGKSPGAASIPPSIAGLPLVTSQAGSQAIAEFNNLHGESFPITTGARAGYGPKHQATLWVAGTESDQTALQLTSLMRDKISQGNSPFEPTGKVQRNGLTVYTLTGMGQNHYYFQSRNLVVWLAVNNDIAEQALTEVLAFYARA